MKTTRAFGAVLALSLSFATVAATAGEASAAPAKKYPNCAALNTDYPAGVGVPGAKDKVAGGGRGVTNFTRNVAVYKANAARLDRDKDGIIRRSELLTVRATPRPGEAGPNRGERPRR